MAEHHLRAAECHLEQAKNIVSGRALFDLIVVLLINPIAGRIFVGKHEFFRSFIKRDPDRLVELDSCLSSFAKILTFGESSNFRTASRVLT